MRSEGLFWEYYLIFHKVADLVEGTVFHFSSLPLFLQANNQVCERTLSLAGDSRCQGYTKTLAPSLLRSYTMSTPSSASAGNGAGGERFDVHGDLGSNGKSLSWMGLTRERWCCTMGLVSRLDMNTCQTSIKTDILL